MAYSKRTQKSRKYRKNGSYSKEQPEDSCGSSSEEQDFPLAETTCLEEKKTSKPFGFLSSLFGSGEKTERSDSPIFSALGYDIYLDDLLLIGIIILLMTDKVEDEILLVILVYLLLDIF